MKLATRAAIKRARINAPLWLMTDREGRLILFSRPTDQKTIREVFGEAGC